MAFDNPDRNDGWKEIIEEMSATMVQMAEEIVKVRESIAPLLEKHQREEKQRLELEQRQQASMVELARQAQQYSVQRANQVFSLCDCSPNRTAALAGQFSDWIDDQIARYNNKKN